MAAYVAERIRMYCEQKYGEEALYGQGLQVHTTVDSRLQALAVTALRDGLHEYNRRRGYIGPAPRARAPRPRTPPARSGGRPPLGHRPHGEGRRASPWAWPDLTFDLGPKAWAWAKGSTPTKTFQAGDRVLLFVREGGEAPVLELDQEPMAQGGPHGHGPAHRRGEGPGGRLRLRHLHVQPGHPGQAPDGIRGEAPDLRHGPRPGGAHSPTRWWTSPLLLLTGRERAATALLGGLHPRAISTPTTSGSSPTATALEHSVNIAAVHLLNQIGYAPVIDLARKLHISAKLKPYPSMALGAFEITLWELTAAYAALDNGGVWMEPRFMNRIADREGKTLEEFRSVSSDPSSTPPSAYVLVQGMTGVIQRGTAGSVREHEGPLRRKDRAPPTISPTPGSWGSTRTSSAASGPAGTTTRPWARDETGARVALPIWRKFMEPACQGQESLDFQMPEGVTKVLVDPRTGLRAGMDSPCTEIREEVFVEGTEPKGVLQRGRPSQGAPPLLPPGLSREARRDPRDARRRHPGPPAGQAHGPRLERGREEAGREPRQRHPDRARGGGPAAGHPRPRGRHAGPPARGEPPLWRPGGVHPREEIGERWMSG